MKKIRILIAEDHKLVRETWTSMLNTNERFQVVAACSDTAEAISTARKKRPDIILMDINILPLNGFQATARLFEISPEFKVIGLSFHSEISCVQKMFDSGARGYLTKNSGCTEMMEAIVHVYEGSSYICAEIREKGFEITPKTTIMNSPTSLLTNQETLVTRYIHDGLRSKEIAVKLDISVRTVATHRYNIFRKLNINSSISLISLLNSTYGYTKFTELDNVNIRNAIA
jgi:DNA-binding NarL/FixJ family response regulator